MTKLMIVDDASFMRVTIKEILKDQPYEIVGEASDGYEAVSLAKECSPDIITLDITMPNMNGIDALKAIRAHNKDVKIIMVSAMGQENMIKDAVISGANSFIVKPFQKDKLIAVLDSLCPK